MITKRMGDTLREFYRKATNVPAWGGFVATSIIEDPNATPTTDAYSLVDFVMNLQQLVFAAGGAIAVAMIIWGGVTLMTSGGNEERTAKGKKILTYAIGGVILILTAQVLVVLLISALGGRVGPTPEKSGPYEMNQEKSGPYGIIPEESGFDGRVVS